MKVVTRTLPLKVTVELLMKFVPFTVKVNAAPPIMALIGETLVMVGVGLIGAGLTMVKGTAFEVPPPGAGLVTVTAAVPAEANAAAGMAAVNCVELTKAVVRAAPAKLTTDAEMKFVPLTVSATSALLPATALVGEITVIVGRGLPLRSVEVVPPPPQAVRSTRFTTTKITSALVSGVLLFIKSSL